MPEDVTGPDDRRGEGDPSVHPSDLARAQRIRAAGTRRRIESARERERIAGALHDVVSEALRRAGVSKGSVYARAGLAHGSDGTSKAARHYELPPGPGKGSDEARRRRVEGLTKDPARYIRLVDALAEMTGADASAMLVRVFGGTSVESAASTGWDDPDHEAARRLVASALADGMAWMLRKVPELDLTLRFARRNLLRYDPLASEWRDQTSFEPGSGNPMAWYRGPEAYLGRIGLDAMLVDLSLERADGSVTEAAGSLATDADVWLCVRRADPAMIGQPDTAGIVPSLWFAVAETTRVYAPETMLPGGAAGVRADDLSPCFLLAPNWPGEFVVPGGTLTVTLPDDDEEWPEIQPVDWRSRCYGPSFVQTGADGLGEMDARTSVVRAGPLTGGASPYHGCRSIEGFSSGMEALLRRGYPDGGPAVPEGVARVTGPGTGRRGPLECLRESAEAMVLAMGRWRNGHEADLDEEMRGIAAGYRDD